MSADTPFPSFLSSGALSRAYYSLVRKTESASSIQQADRYLLDEINSIRVRLFHPALTLTQCKECLVVLLYCSMSITSGILGTGAMDYALSHAVNLAEAGKTVGDKRIGYLFCTEMMPPNHELQLMLVNTLRKDLESSETPRICLALDSLVMSSTEDVIPAVQSRLYELLSHNSPHVRRRALLVFRSLSHHDLEVLQRITGKVIKRLTDVQPTVVGAALLVSTDLSQISPPDRETIHDTINGILETTWSNSANDKSKQGLLLKVLSALRSFGLSKNNHHIVFEIIRSARSHGHVLLRDAFSLLSTLPLETLAPSQVSPRLSSINNIRQLLVSPDANDQYLFLSCLECLDPSSWAGTNPEIPAALEGWEVERVMQLLDSSDSLIRKKTLQILNKIDTNIIESYYSQSLQTIPLTLSVKAKDEYATRLLEVVQVQAGEDGELYARQAKTLIGLVENSSSSLSGKQSVSVSVSVLEGVVEMILTYLRNSSTTFCIGCATTLVTVLAEPEEQLGPTMMVIISALASEYCSRLSIPPVAILRGVAERLSTYSPSVQDACLLAMIRISAECEKVPEEVLAHVSRASQFAGRHIRGRCEQFITLSGQKTLLSEIVKQARSPSLPDFLEALQSHNISKSPESSSRPTSPRARSSNPSSPKKTPSAAKLRYDAYERPQPIPRLRRPSSSQRSVSSDQGGYELSRVSSRVSVTAGELTLAAGAEQFEMMARASSTAETIPKPADATSRPDLIAFDSPFITEPSDGPVEPDFENIWNATDTSHSARGWCDASIENTLRRLQTLEKSRLKVIAVDRPPFEGDLKVVITSTSGDSGLSMPALLRLREGEEESCLWQLRCTDDARRVSIRKVLAG